MGQIWINLQVNLWGALLDISVVCGAISMAIGVEVSEKCLRPEFFENSIEN